MDNDTKAMAANLRAHFPSQESFGPATTWERKLIHDAAGRLETLNATNNELLESLSALLDAMDGNGSCQYEALREAAPLPCDGGCVGEEV